MGRDANIAETRSIDSNRTSEMIENWLLLARQKQCTNFYPSGPFR